jgi:hypothetical protein
MLNSFNRLFDYSDYEKKLRHYFTDSAPINADITVGVQEVRISRQSSMTVVCDIDGKLSVEENVKKVIDACIASLYPKMIVSKRETIRFTDEQKKALLMQGFSVEQIHEKGQRRNWVCYTLTRFNEHESIIDYIEDLTRVRYRMHLYKPLISVRDKIWKLAFGGREGMEELYRYLMSISKQEVLDDSNIEDKGCGIQESL